MVGSIFRAGVMVASTALVAAAMGCSSGKVTDATSKSEVSEDGRTATQTRSRMRETPSGTMVKETQIQKREVMSPSTQSMGMPDATKRDPGSR